MIGTCFTAAAADREDPRDAVRRCSPLPIEGDLVVAAGWTPPAPPPAAARGRDVWLVRYPDGSMMAVRRAAG